MASTMGITAFADRVRDDGVTVQATARSRIEPNAVGLTCGSDRFHLLDADTGEAIHRSDPVATESNGVVPDAREAVRGARGVAPYLGGTVRDLPGDLSENLPGS